MRNYLCDFLRSGRFVLICVDNGFINFIYKIQVCVGALQRNSLTNENLELDKKQFFGKNWFLAWKTFRSRIENTNSGIHNIFFSFFNFYFIMELLNKISKYFFCSQFHSLRKIILREIGSEQRERRPDICM